MGKLRIALYKFFIGSEKFMDEFRRQVRMLIMITLGFTIAFTWRQTTFDISQSFVNFFLKLESNTALSILASTFITFSSLLIIYLTSHMLKERKNRY